MVFSSSVFLFVFLPAVLFGYCLLPHRFRLPFLFLANLVFYGWGEPVFVLLMVFSIVVNYGDGLLIGRFPKYAKFWLIAGLFVNIALLLWFKYAGLLFGIEGITLPIGISFYTFQAMSYIIDVYRRETAPQKNFIAYGTYISLFPQLIAGPIVKYHDIEDQLFRKWTPDPARIYSGCRRFVTGLSKKLLLANAMGNLWEQLSGMYRTGGTLGAWAAILAYTFQIYFDFSGYSDMAIGLGRLLGFEFMENFNYPYISASVTEFWRRWHISLSTWFKEYVYIPLGGNRKGLPRQILNIVIVWALTGLWHGASWNFLYWGLFYALFLVAEKLFLLKFLQKVPAFFRHFYLMLVVMVGWVLFVFPDPKEITGFLGAMCGRCGAAVSADSLRIILGYLPMLFLCALLSLPLPKNIWKKLPLGGTARIYAESAILAVLFFLCIGALISESYNPFIYFRF